MTKLVWGRTPEKGWGLWKGLSRHTKICDPARRIDRSPKTRKWKPSEKEMLIQELERRGKIAK